MIDFCSWIPKSPPPVTSSSRPLSSNHRMPGVARSLVWIRMGSHSCPSRRSIAMTHWYVLVLTYPQRSIELTTPD